MKKLILLFAALWAAAFAAVSCSDKPSMKIVDSVIMPYSEIRGIAAEGPFDIIVTDHPEWGIQFHTNKYLMKKIRFGVDRSVFWVRLDPVDIEPNSVLEIYVPARSLATLSLSGTAYAYIEYPQIVQGSADYSLTGASALTLNAPVMFGGDLMLSASGASEVYSEKVENYLGSMGQLMMRLEDGSAATLAQVTAQGAQSFSLTGASELRIAGQVGTGSLVTTQFILNGASKVEAIDYAARDVSVTAAGGSIAQVRAGQSLVYRLSSLSKLDYYYNNPSLSVTQLELSGGSTVEGHPDAQPASSAVVTGADTVMMPHFRFEAPVRGRTR